MAELPTIKELFKAGAHFGHVKNRTDARAKDYIFTYRNRVSVIDLEKTLTSLTKTLEFIAAEAKKGSMILFVGTKPQAQEKIKEVAEKNKQPYVTERWPGGLLTNFEMITKSIKGMLKIEQDIAENKYESLTKKERLVIEKGLIKKQKIFGGLRVLDRKPGVVFVVDAARESIAIAEAIRSNIKTAALCDTNSNPKMIDYPIVANDDSKLTIEMLLELVSETFAKNYKQQVSETENEVSQRVEQAIKIEEGPKQEAPTDGVAGVPTAPTMSDRSSDQGVGNSVGKSEPVIKKSAAVKKTVKKVLKKK